MRPYIRRGSDTLVNEAVLAKLILIYARKPNAPAYMDEYTCQRIMNGFSIV